MRYYTGHACTCCGSLKTREITHARLLCDNCGMVLTMRALLRKRQSRRDVIDANEYHPQAA